MMDLSAAAALLLMLAFSILVGGLIGTYLYKRWKKREEQKRKFKIRASHLCKEVILPKPLSNAEKSMQSFRKAVEEVGKRTGPPPIPTTQTNAVVRHSVNSGDANRYRRSAQSTDMNGNVHVVDLDHRLHVSESSGSSYGGGYSSGSSGGSCDSGSSDSGSSCSSD